MAGSGDRANSRRAVRERARPGEEKCSYGECGGSWAEEKQEREAVFVANGVLGCVWWGMRWEVLERGERVRALDRRGVAGRVLGHGTPSVGFAVCGGGWRSG